MKKRNNNLIGLSGRIGSGKNTAATLINEILGEYKQKPYSEVAFADLLKQIASMMTGVPLDEFYTEEGKNKELGPEWATFDQNGLKIRMTRRLFLQKLGSDACNAKLHPNCWVNSLFSKWDEDSKWMICDVRFPQELAAIQEKNGVIIRITRPDQPKSNHISETALDNYTGFDFNVVNNGSLEQLKEKLKVILLQLNMI